MFNRIIHFKYIVLKTLHIVYQWQTQKFKNKTFTIVTSSGLVDYVQQQPAFNLHNVQ